MRKVLYSTKAGPMENITSFLNYRQKEMSPLNCYIKSVYTLCDATMIGSKTAKENWDAKSGAFYKIFDTITDSLS